MHFFKYISLQISIVFMVSNEEVVLLCSLDCYLTCCLIISLKETLQVLLLLVLSFSTQID
jgi:hypothetical protein